MTQRITIDPITRLEGHGKIEIFLNDDGDVANTYFQIPELRGFERFCVGRPVEEMPLLTNRICGVCPEAHHMAAAKAADMVYHVDPPHTAKLLRELLYSAFYFTDHTTHFYALGGPDFIMGPDAPVAERNILGVIHKVGLEVGGKVIQARKYGHTVVEMIGGRKVHPCTSIPGGLTKGITEEQRKEIESMGHWAIEFAQFSLKLFSDIVLGNQKYVDLILGDIYNHHTYYMGMVDENNKINFYDGKVRVDPDGKEFVKYAPKDYTEVIAEHVEPWTYLKFPYLKKVGWKGFVDGKDSGVYMATPLSRLNASEGFATPRAQEEYEKYGKVPNIVFPTGAMVKDEMLYIYYGAADTTCAVASCKLETLLEDMLETRIKQIRLNRFSGNPVIKPNPKLPWQSRAVFNPTALYEYGRVHLAYRAMSEDNTSVIGFASSGDGYTFEDQPPEPIYTPRENFEAKLVPGGNSGCEDPRLTRIDETIYMLYTAFNGRSEPRVALSHISVDDFIARCWNWSRPILISPPNVPDKDTAIFPKKINGKYAILHRLGVSIWLDMVDDLKFEGNKWLGGHIIMSPKDELADTEKVCISGPPIETKHGWLLLYHCVSRKTQPMTYYVATALLDLKDPSKVIARRKVPILEPETPYELYGQVNNVVFPCGAVIIGDELFVYYGGADSVIGVATMKVSELMNSLITWAGLETELTKLVKKK